jgi:Homeodomain-like domain-containing protein
MEKFRVTLADEERELLGHVASAGKAAARKLAHARILLLADEGPGGPRRADEDITGALGVSPSTIARVRRRFVAEGDV